MKRTSKTNRNIDEFPPTCIRENAKKNSASGQTNKEKELFLKLKTKKKCSDDHLARGRGEE